MTTILQQQTYHLFGHVENSREANKDLVQLIMSAAELPNFLIWLLGQYDD